MKRLRRAVLAGLMFLTVSFAYTAYADVDISVRMDAVISAESVYVNFADVKPMQIDDRTLVPARDMAEAAGLKVDWDQPTQTAILTLKADASSEKPIERFAAQAINQIDGFVMDLTPVSITAALKLNEDDAVIRYNFVDSEGDNVPMGKHYQMVSRAMLINDGTLMVPIRDSMEMFGLAVGWNQEELCAFVSVPEKAAAPTGLGIIANHGDGKYAPDKFTSVTVNPDNPPEINHSVGQYIGRFKITHYCPCEICNGGWGAHTAWAGELIPGQTIAVNPNTIPKLSWVYIDGYGYRRAEDTGSGIGEYQIDMAVATHEEAMSRGVVYKDVYFAE